MRKVCSALAVPAPSAAAILGARKERGVEAGRRLRDAYAALAAGEAPKLEPEELRGLQVLALDILQETFDNAFGDDGPLKAEVSRKLGAMSGSRLEPGQVEAILESTPAAERQKNAMRVALATFASRSREDEALRSALLEKLGKVGEATDIAHALRYARHGTAADIWNAVESVRNIARREGPLMTRSKNTLAARLVGRNWAVPETSSRFPLGPEVLEAVLEQGRVVDAQPIHRGNYTKTFRLVFDKWLPGRDGAWRPVRGLFKPEEIRYGADRTSFPREATAYAFDKAFTQTGLFPPTVEAVVPMHDDVQLGSIQYWLEDARVAGKTVHEWAPELGHLWEKPRFQDQMSTAATMVFIYNDPDKLKNNVTGQANFMNMMVDSRDHLWFIDNAGAFGGLDGVGGLWGEVSKEHLPERPVPEFVEHLRGLNPEAAKTFVAARITPEEGSNVARRLKTATDELRARIPRT